MSPSRAHKRFSSRAVAACGVRSTTLAVEPSNWITTTLPSSISTLVAVSVGFGEVARGETEGSGAGVLVAATWCNRDRAADCQFRATTTSIAAAWAKPIKPIAAQVRGRARTASGAVAGVVSALARDSLADVADSDNAATSAGVRASSDEVIWAHELSHSWVDGSSGRVAFQRRSNCASRLAHRGNEHKSPDVRLRRSSPDRRSERPVRGLLHCNT